MISSSRIVEKPYSEPATTSETPRSVPCAASLAYCSSRLMNTKPTMNWTMASTAQASGDRKMRRHSTRALLQAAVMTRCPEGSAGGYGNGAEEGGGGKEWVKTC